MVTAHELELSSLLTVCIYGKTPPIENWTLAGEKKQYIHPSTVGTERDYVPLMSYLFIPLQ